MMNIIKMSNFNKLTSAYVFRLYDVNDKLLYRTIVIDNCFHVDFYDEVEDWFFNLGKF